VATLERSEKTISGKIEMERFLRVRSVDYPVDQPQVVVAFDASANVSFEYIVIDARKKAVDIAPEDEAKALAIEIVEVDGIVRYPAFANTGRTRREGLYLLRSPKR
jgi:uncharacterized protein (DUF934 family)